MSYSASLFAFYNFIFPFSISSDLFYFTFHLFVILFTKYFAIVIARLRSISSFIIWLLFLHFIFLFFWIFFLISTNPSKFSNQTFDYCLFFFFLNSSLLFVESGKWYREMGMGNRNAAIFYYWIICLYKWEKLPLL